MARIRKIKAEKVVQKEILDYLKDKGIFAWKEHSTGAMVGGKDKRYMPIGLTGKADIIGIYRGKFLAIEVKREGGDPSDKQVEFIKKINESGGIAFIARSLDDVKNRGI